MAEERVRQALLFEPTGDKLRCLTCERRRLLGEGETGFCGTRQNSGGRLYTLEYGDISSMSISFNEPTLLLEYSLDVFRLAKEASYYNTYITNGYMTETALDLLVEHGLDALNIDIKGPPEAVRRYCGADGNVVWRNALRAKERGIWVEFATLVIPGVNDAEEDLRQVAQRAWTSLREHVLSVLRRALD